MSFTFDPSTLDDSFGWGEGPDGYGLGTVVDEIRNGLSGIYGITTAGATKNATLTSGNILDVDDIVVSGWAAKVNGGSEVSIVAVSGVTLVSSSATGVVHYANDYSGYDSVALNIVPVS